MPVHVFKTFLYRLTPEMSDCAVEGCRILVPLGRNLVVGYIVSLHATLPAESKIAEADVKEARELIDTVPLCTPEILQISKWVSEYYASPWGEAIKAALPPGISPAVHEFVALTEAGRDLLSAGMNTDSGLKRQILEVLTKRGQIRRDALIHLTTPSQLSNTLRELSESGLISCHRAQSTSFIRPRAIRFARLREQQLDTPSLTAKQKRVIQQLENVGSLSLRELCRETSAGASTVASLEKKGLLEIYIQNVRRDPLAASRTQSQFNYTLTSAQSSVLEQIEQQLTTQTFGSFLLHGVTGSGKTEVYIRAMRATLDLGRSAMMLVPEIALTPVFSQRLRSHFGDQVAIFHSSLKRGERFDEWTRVRDGEARVVIGTRSAVFAPVKNLGLIVVDEEHESTYRQQDSPFYNGRDTAIMRARNEAATVVLGSATPSLESFHNARTGKYVYLNLPERIGARPMAAATIIDMRSVFARNGKTRVFSEELLTAIHETHARGEQSIILLNRRGYSSYVLCRSCGETVQCPNCDVTLTYHRAERVMLCHYCNYHQPVPAVCPSCRKKYIYYVGEGTEQLEEILKESFPALRIARVDRDSAARRRFETTLTEFSEGHIDMLVGTQMLAKGHDFPNVTLVGVVSVDAGLALPDFRSAERTFQLITQVAGRAGRGDRRGQVLIQTYHPFHYAFRHAAAQDYDGFYNEEVRYRQNHSYPPFVALATLLVHGRELDRVRNQALELRKELDAANKDRSVRVLGPAPAPLARLKGEHRFQLLLKSKNRRQLRSLADTALQSMVSRGVNLRSINLEIDPISIM
ncbi:MAG: primosomal protein N' [Pyrinomonadaceae bacterium]